MPHCLRFLISVSCLAFVLTGCIPVFLGYHQVIEYLAVSPDGGKLAFLYSNHRNDRRFLYICDRDGKHVTQVATFNARGFDPADVDRYRRLPHHTLQNTAAPCDFTDFRLEGRSDGAYLWSPGMPLAGDGFRSSRSQVGGGSELEWAANGEIFCLDGAGNMVSLKADGTMQWLLEAPRTFSRVCPNYEPSNFFGFEGGGFDVSADGNRLVSTHGVVFDDTGSVQDVLLRFLYPRGLAYPRFSPDGKSIAAVALPTGYTGDEMLATSAIVVIDPESELKHEWSMRDGWRPLDLYWVQPDLLMCQVVRENETKIATFRPDGSEFRIVETDGAWGRLAHSPDGSSVYQIATDGPYRRSLFALDLATGTRRRLVDAETLPKDEALYAN